MLMTGIRKLKSSCKPSTWSHYFRTEQKLKRALKYSSFDICSSSLPKRAHSIVSEREMNLIKVEKHAFLFSNFTTCESFREQDDDKVLLVDTVLLLVK